MDKVSVGNQPNHVPILSNLLQEKFNLLERSIEIREQPTV